MTDPANMKPFESELRQLETKMEAERRVLQKVHRTSLGFAALIAGIVLTFLLVNYFKVRAEMTPEKFGMSIEQELKEVGPVALREFSTLGQDLLPIYVAEWKRQLQAAWPEISKKVENEIVRLGDNLTTRLNEKLSATESRVLEKTRLTIFEKYPDLKDPQKQQQIEKRLHEICDGALEKAILDFDKLFSKDVASMQDVILGFDVSDSEESPVDLQKKFLHLWLQLLDQEIMKI